MVFEVVKKSKTESKSKSESIWDSPVSCRMTGHTYSNSAMVSPGGVMDRWRSEKWVLGFEQDLSQKVQNLSQHLNAAGMYRF